MTTKIVRPNDVEENYLNQIIDLVIAGGEIKVSKIQLRQYILRADLIAFSLLDSKIICTATLKNPFAPYKAKVFLAAKVSTNSKYNKELGYIATHSNFEGKGHCSNLLKLFIKHIPLNSTYATTRKPAMVHILNKFNFVQTGEIYNDDLMLLTHNENS